MQLLSGYCNVIQAYRTFAYKILFPRQNTKAFSDKLTALNRVYFSVSLILRSMLKKKFIHEEISPLKEKKKNANQRTEFTPFQKKK